MAARYSPYVDPLRVCYDIDTRAAGFLVGAISAILWAPCKASHAASRANFEVLGWGGLAVLLFLDNYLNEFRLGLYRGNTFQASLASTSLIIDASNPTAWLG
ncbi:MAG TPA: hypothetical protein VGA72_07295 [Anaerolineales bacterium]